MPAMTEETKKVRKLRKKLERRKRKLEKKLRRLDKRLRELVPLQIKERADSHAATQGPHKPKRKATRRVAVKPKEKKLRVAKPKAVPKMAPNEGAAGVTSVRAGLQ